MTTVALAEYATAKGHEILYRPLTSASSFTIEDEDGAHIFLSQSIRGTQEKEHLAHELGHCEYGGFYNRYSKYDVRGKAERRADKWAFSRLLPVGEIRAACQRGLREIWELADLFDVSYEYAAKAIRYYQSLGLI